MTVIKTEIRNLYKKSFAKFSEESLNEVENENGEDYNDHDYVENVESTELVPIIKNEKAKETKKKSKKVSISETPVELQVNYLFCIINYVNFRNVHIVNLNILFTF